MGIYFQISIQDEHSRQAFCSQMSIWDEQCSQLSISDEHYFSDDYFFSSLLLRSFSRWVFFSWWTFHMTIFQMCTSPYCDADYWTILETPIKPNSGMSPTPRTKKSGCILVPQTGIEHVGIWKYYWILVDVNFDVHRPQKTASVHPAGLKIKIFSETPPI